MLQFTGLAEYLSMALPNFQCNMLVNNAMYQVSVSDQYQPFLHKSSISIGLVRENWYRCIINIMRACMHASIRTCMHS